MKWIQCNCEATCIVCDINEPTMYTLDEYEGNENEGFKLCLTHAQESEYEVEE